MKGLAGASTTISGTASDATTFYQPIVQSGYAIGYEVAEAPTHTPSQTPDCTGTYPCRYSDLLLGYYQTQSNGLVGYIYGTTSRSTTIGSITTANLISIDDEILWPLLGDELNKIGQRTGWTYGTVAATCVSQLIPGRGTYTYMMCFNGVDAGSFSGDSGANVFYYNGSNNTAQLAGQLFGGRNGRTVIGNDTIFNQFMFASMNNIQAQFGNLITTIHGWY